MSASTSPVRTMNDAYIEFVAWIVIFVLIYSNVAVHLHREHAYAGPISTNPNILAFVQGPSGSTGLGVSGNEPPSEVHLAPPVINPAPPTITIAWPEFDLGYLYLRELSGCYNPIGTTKFGAPTS